jgi:hypothetical protein
LTDSTDNPNGRRRARLLAQVVASTVILALAAGSFATTARADGDPASDVLATQPLFGLESLNPVAPGNPSALAGLKIPAGGAVLGTVALTAIQRLADASGHSVQIPPATASTSASGGVGTIPLIALFIGAALIAVAWTASLRARPPRLRRGKASSA